jgi:ABC-type glycerol-3-phosphate transport system substrate-binding protein
LLLVRVKRVEGVGGIISTLRSASAVAPGALPDLTLLPRQHLLAAADAGLVVPLDDLLPATIHRNLYSQALALGQIDGQLYGVPYFLEIPHIVYRETVFDAPPTTFDAILEAGQPFVFAAGQESGVNETLFIQYLAAGGRVADEDGAPLLDEVPLLIVLEFYEQAVAEGLVDATVLDYISPASYWEDFVNGEQSLVQVDSSTYLASRAQIPNAVPAALPTADGEPLTALDGWLWVLTTADPDRQHQAIAFLDWMMRAENQAAFTQAMGIVPSQRTALRLWDESRYSVLVETLLDAQPVLIEANTAVTAALQAALTSVLTGELSAAEAAAEAVTALP